MRSSSVTQPVDNSACSKAAFGTLLSAARRTEKAYLQTISNLSIDGRSQKARKALDFYFESYHCRLAALHEANRRAKPHRRLPEGLIAEEAKALSLRKKCDEPVRVFTKWKQSGGFRFIYDFGPRNRMRQMMIAKGLRALHGHTLHDQFAINGGRDVCISELLERLGTGSSVCFAEVDIRDCFGSINPQKLKKEIGLSDDTIENVVGCASYNIISMACPLNAALKCRNGIPQGSLCSPIVAAIVVSRVLKAADLKGLISYADNIGLIGSDEESVRVQKKTLITALNGSPFGTFGVHLRGQNTTSVGIDFLGYHIKNVEDEFEIEPNGQAITTLLRRLLKTARQRRGKGRRRAIVLHILDGMLDRWLPGYALSSLDRNTFMLRRFVEYISSKPIRGLTLDEIGMRFDQWNERLSKALMLRGPFSKPHSALCNFSIRDES